MRSCCGAGFSQGWNHQRVRDVVHWLYRPGQYCVRRQLWRGGWHRIPAAVDVVLVCVGWSGRVCDPGEPYGPTNETGVSDATGGRACCDVPCGATQP